MERNGSPFSTHHNLNGGTKRYKFPLNRENKYRARLSFQPIQVKPSLNGEDVNGLQIVGLAIGGFYGLKVGKKALDGTLKFLDAPVGATVAGYNKFRNFIKGPQGPEVNIGQTNIGALAPGGSTAAAKTISEITLSAQEVDDLAQAVKDYDRYTMNYERIPEKCYLHVPTSLSFNDNVSVGSSNLGTVGALGLSALNYDNPGMVSNFFAAGLEYGKDFFTSIGLGIPGLSGDRKNSISDEAARLSAQRLSGFLPVPGQDAIQSAVTVASQTIANPNTRSTFQNVNIRTFSFSFKFIPLSREESTEVENIITFFRKFLYPEHAYLKKEDPNNPGSNSTAVPVGYKFPPLFDIKVGYDINGNGRYENLPNMEIHYCYLTAVTHNYNPQSASFYEGGKPTEIDFTLAFTEYRTLSRSDVTNEYGRTKDASDGVMNA